MAVYAFWRLVQAAATLLIVSAVIFVVIRLIGDPTYLMLPPEATEADRQVLRVQMGLADPVVVQYARFLWQILHGNLGISYRFSLPALSVVLQRIGPTLLLTSSALGLGIAVGVPLGVLSAAHRGGWIDALAKGVATIGQAAPPFFLGLIFVKVFSVSLGWLPTSGFGGPRYLIMPAVALGWYAAAGLIRLTRSTMIDVLGAEYIKMARIKGMRERSVIAKHALKNVALPVITFAGLQFGVLMGGAVSIEAVFAWPGMGTLILESISNLDFTVVQAAVMVSALLFTLINLAVDLLYAFIDPRISYE